MTLIKSVSGIRGTIGNIKGDNLTPEDLVKFTSAYVHWIKSETGINTITIVVGRDARPSGEMVYRIVSGTLTAMGANVVNLNLATTPTVEMAVAAEKAHGGIILSASHNPVEWNALKLLNHRGEFVNANEGDTILSIAENQEIEYSGVENLGRVIDRDGYLDHHIEKIIGLGLVDPDAINSGGYKVAVDGINSVGGFAIPQLLRALKVREIIELNCDPTGNFAHNPEPLPQNLGEISATVREAGAHLGFAVDPDVDRLAIVDENGDMFGEEYTLVAVADYVLQQNPGSAVSNLSSTKALGELTRKYGGKYFPSAVGEINVVEKMKEVNAVIGGEGNGGVIFPGLHYGRDALVGIALFMTHLARSGLTCSELRKRYPGYYISKNKMQLKPDTNVDEIIIHIKDLYGEHPVNDVDGVRIDFDEGWIHLRKSNTEPILRIYSEGNDREIAEDLASGIMDSIKKMI
jgi:phosphomannomutase